LEQSVLQRLSVFKMSFTLDAAIGVSSCEVLKPNQLAELVQRLVAKSLLSMDQVNGTTRYRFLNTTRTYALEKLEHSGQLRLFEQRYSHYISRARWFSGVQVPLELVE
jgi:predicted ATPase